MVEFFEFLLSYETLRVIWWLFLGLMLTGFAIMGGFDIGVGTLLPFLGKNDEERRVIINVIGPTWEGNQVWFVLAGAAIFAAYPAIYAAAFSGFFVALILTLFALILRPGGFKYRNLIKEPRWRNTWDWCLFIGSVVPGVVFGVAFGNLLLGVPFVIDPQWLGVTYEGGFFGLLNPFGLLAGLVSIAMLIMHGAVYLQLKTEGDIQARAQRCVMLAGLVLIGAFALAGVGVAFFMDGYVLTRFAGTEAPSNPMAKEVIREAGAWLNNYSIHSWTLVAPLAAFAGAGLTLLLSARQQPGLGFITSAIAIAGVILTAGFAMFPFIMPSSLDPNSSLTAWDATSSHLTLKWMFAATVIFLPLIMIYTSWVFSKLRGTMTVQKIRDGSQSLY
jgi:cytochrome d ubiquinol oxidase subunit II